VLEEKAFGIFWGGREGSWEGLDEGAMLWVLRGWWEEGEGMFEGVDGGRRARKKERRRRRRRRRRGDEDIC